MNAARLYEILPECLSAEGEGQEIVVHRTLIWINTAKAEKHRAELTEIMDDYPQPDRLREGLSYIEIAGVVGDQRTTLILFAVGKFLGFWDLITPATLNITGPMADQMAGQGMIMTNGYAPQREEVV